jgi:hypothetical protein
MITLLLEESHYDVRERRGRRAGAGEERWRAVADVNLAGAMNGIELAFIAKQSHPDLDVIVTSGRPLPRSLPDGAKFWSKPWAPLDVLREAELALARAPLH